MKVLFSLVQLRPGVSGGIALYAKNLACHLANNHSDVELHLAEVFYNHKYFCEMPEGKCTRHLLRQPYRYHDEMLELICEIKPDVVFYPVTAGEPFLNSKETKFIVCIADLQHITYPEYFPEGDIYARNKAFTEAIDSSDHIVTLSQYSKSEICSVYGLQEDNVSVVSPALDKSYFLNKKLTLKQDLMEKYDIPSEYIFYPANFWAHKNHNNLFKAIKILYDDGLSINLVLTGDLYSERPDLASLVDELGIKDNVYVLGYIEQNDVNSLINYAKMIVFPSLFEGFGIPILEAYSNSIPLCCSNITSLPEVAGKGALLFDPNEPVAIVGAIKKLYFDDDQCQQLVNQGKKQLEKYNYEKSVQVLYECFKSLLNENIGVLDSVDITSKPLVSIVTPSFNQGEFIEETIKSVLCQTYKNIEYIIMDGGSSDNTVQVLEKYSKYIKWVSEPDKGQTDAINKGLKIAKGDYFCYLNSDDTFEIDAIDNMLKYLQSHQEVSLVYGDADYIDKNGGVTSAYETHEWDFVKFKGHCFICQPSTMWRKETLTTFGYFDESLHYIMDYEYWLRIANNGGLIHYFPRKISNSRLYEETKTMSCRGRVFNEIFSVTRSMFGETSYQWKKAYALYLSTEKYNYFDVDPKSNLLKSIAALILVILFPSSSYSYAVNKIRYIKARARNKLINTIKKYGLKKPANENLIVSGMYADGWVSNTLLINYPKGRELKEVLLEGESFKRQILTIEIDGQVFQEKIDEHEFSLKLPVTSNPVKNIYVYSDIQCNNFLSRELAFILTYTNLFTDLDVLWKV